MSKIKVAMIGCGGRNGVHFQKFTTFDDVEFVGFCDVVIEKAQGFAENAARARFLTATKPCLPKPIPMWFTSPFRPISTVKSNLPSLKRVATSWWKSPWPLTTT